MAPSVSNASAAPVDRFWIPADRTYYTDQLGWLMGRSEGPFFSANTDMVSTQELASRRCLVLLGEPGIGKSTTVSPDSPLVTARPEAQALRFDLASYSTEDRLIRTVLEGREVTSWLEGDYELCLTLDSFDEAHTRIETLHLVLADYLDTWDCARLQLRIVSRTAEWPTSLERRLEKHFDEVVPFELLPLRRQDAGNIARSYGLDPEPFLSAIEASQVVPLASRPLTLRLLAETYKNEGTLPRRSADIYKRGLLALCEEINPERRDAKGPTRHQGAELFAAASRLAAFSIFSGRQCFWLGPTALAEPEDLSIHECSTGATAERDTPARFTVAANEAVLQTGIFSGSGSQRLTWAHATFADYLASEWVKANGLLREQIEALLGSESGKLHPRVRQIAGWLVAASEQYAWLIDLDPEAFLLNVEIPDASLRRRIVSAVISLAQRGRMHHDYQRKFSGLTHPDLADQVRGALEADSFESKRIGIDIALQCEVQDALPDLISIALDNRVELGLRVPAAWAIEQLSKGDPGSALLPILQSPMELGGDPTQTKELIAAALMASWPHAISTAQMFEFISPEHGRTSFGTYSVALSEVARSLRPEDLCAACEWLLSKPNLVGESSIAPLEDTILRLCLEHLEEGPVLAAATLIIKRRVQGSEAWISTSMAQPFNLPVEVRRKLALSLLEDDDPVLIAGMTGLLGDHGPALLSIEDFDWLTEQYMNTSGIQQRNIGTALQLVADSGDRAMWEKVLGLPNDHPVAKVFESWRGPIDLNSPAAHEARRMYRLKAETRNRIAERKEREASTDAQVRSEFASMAPLARDGDVTAFWKLARRLMLPPSSSIYRNESQPDLTKHPRWETLSPETQEELITAAYLYLQAGRCEPKEWIGKRVRHYPAVAGYCALILLLRKRPQLLPQLEQSVWREWAPIIVGWGPMADRNGVEDRREIITMALPYAREELTQTLLKLIEVAIAEHSNIYLEDELELLLTEPLAATILDKLQATSVPIRPMTDLIDALLGSYPELVRPLLLDWVQPDQQVANPERAREAALNLLFVFGRAAWPAIFELMSNTPDFFKSALLSMQPLVGRPGPDLEDAELASLYNWLVEMFPPAEDLRSEEGGVLGPLEAVAMWRDNVLETLVQRGSSTAVSEIRRIVEGHPELPGLKFALLRAEQLHLEGSWQPLTPAQIDRLASNALSRVVRSEIDLLDVCVEALNKIQARLQGDTPSSALLWDTFAGRPKSEDDVSDFLRNELSSLLLSSGAVVNREVQIRRVNTGIGERTDLRVDAIAPSGCAYPNLYTIVGEVKGCWNSGIVGSIKRQLIDRYMADLHTKHGIYIAIWFDPESWTPEDARRRKAEALGTPERLRSVLQAEADLYKRAGRHVEVVVLDASRRRPSEERSKSRQ
ncbi:hypothetical protein GC088_10015 [Arthrobacter sp. JZ12]|uniref:NACHT domain-containing protein n=1 Tax=Arthrobacter sp. JZ12 TaxID=2654190 RepID=UPI002B49873C|nr:hypothetical protein [Arthrobacter sp. JZ12]WRH25363.1 hypothetical protein GC088_10015 [Arthrobacter sp. JZ12]